MLNHRAKWIALAAPLLTLCMPVLTIHAEESPVQLTSVPGPFRADAASFKAYQAPAWFRDAKFGIWSHWGPQSVPRAGDW